MSAQSRLTQAAPAVKEQLKARVAITGPAGSGKTFTALETALILAGDGKVLLVDSERRSASLYADRYQFDTIAWTPPYDPDELAATITEAQHSYDVIVVDSMSHWWEGEGGVIDIADGAGSQGNTFVGWKTATPKLRALIEAMLSADAHVIVTMRSKMEYVLETNDKGKQVPRKVGMAPVMRNGIEYEFTLIADMDLDHTMTVSKSRCSLVSGRSYQAGKSREGIEVFAAWLSDGELKASPADLVEIARLFESVTDAAQRTEAKKAFIGEFGRPDAMAADRVDAAKAWIAERVTPVAVDA